MESDHVMSIFEKYFTADYILSRGALINIVLSDRSDGKTVDAKVRILYDYMTYRYIGVYVRRYKTEITKSLRDSFFGQVFTINTTDKKILSIREFYKNAKFTGNKDGIKVDLGYGPKWICFFVVLSMSAKLKSTLDDYINFIRTINFDEYVPLDGRYIPNEIDFILELYRSIDRDRDIVQLIILGNRVSPFMPILDYFNISLSIINAKIRTYRNNTIAVQIYTSSEHVDKRKKSRFAELVSNTEYDSYFYGGILHTLKLKQATLNEQDIYFASFISDLGEGSIWSDEYGRIKISTRQRKDGILITDTLRNTDRETYSITYSRFSQLFRDLYKTNNIFFDSERAYYMFEPLLKQIWR